jgi:hypothetical protein
MRSTVYSVAPYSAFLFAVLVPCLALADRLRPAEVPPVVDGNVRYEAPHGGFGNPGNPCGQIGGCVVAYDSTTDALLWSVKVCCISYDPNLEQDVQWVFITSLSFENGQLLVTNESGLHFAIDLQSRAGAARFGLDARRHAGRLHPGLPAHRPLRRAFPQGQRAGVRTARAIANRAGVRVTARTKAREARADAGCPGRSLRDGLS